MTRLRELQRAEKLTQQELADIAEVSKRTIQNWEDGTSNKNPEESTQRKGKERKGKEIENFAPQHSTFLEKLFRPEQKRDIENIEFLLRRFGIKQEWAKQFNAYLHTNAKEHLQYTEWRSHFANWLKVQKPEFFTPIGAIGFNAVPIKKPKGTLGQN